MNITVTRQACCAADDQIGPLEAEFNIDERASLAELTQQIVASRFLQFSSTHDKIVGDIGGRPIVAVHAPGGLPPVFFVEPSRAVGEVVVAEQTLAFRFGGSGALTAPGGPVDRSTRYRHPHPGALARIAESIANSGALAAARRRLMSRLPFLVLRSDVVEVVYLTWLIPVANVVNLVPPSLTLWSREGLTPFTVLTYRHRHFGPALLGPLRAWCPSPLQSNWRLYLAEAPDETVQGSTVLFTHNVLSNLAYVLGARAMSDALPADLPARFVHEKDADVYRTEIVPGPGSAPSLSSRVRPAAAKALPPAFETVYGHWQRAVELLALQDAAVVEVPRIGRLAYAQIDLPIQPAQVLPAAVESVSCPVAERLGAVGDPLCFIVPEVSFRVCSESLLSVPGG